VEKASTCIRGAKSPYKLPGKIKEKQKNKKDYRGRKSLPQ